MSNVMGPEDAIAWLNTDDYDSAGYHVAVEHAIGALQMQIPMKVKESDYIDYDFNVLTDCPVCGTHLRGGYNYCPNCGQAIET